MKEIQQYLCQIPERIRIIATLSVIFLILLIIMIAGLHSDVYIEKSSQDLLNLTAEEGTLDIDIVPLAGKNTTIASSVKKAKNGITIPYQQNSSFNQSPKKKKKNDGRSYSGTEPQNTKNRISPFAKEKAKSYPVSSRSASSLTGKTYLYKEAVSLYGKKYNMAMTLTSVSAEGHSDFLVDTKTPGIALTAQKKRIFAGSRIAEHAKSIAEHSPQYRYLLGGRTLSTVPGRGIDCAHFVGRVYKDMGIDITSNGADANVQSLRTILRDDIAASYNVDHPILISQMRPGDIVIFFSGGRDSHTAIYIGNGKIAHAADPRLNVCVTDMNYDETTGIAGYNHKIVQYIIRPYKDTVEKKSGRVTINASVDITDPDTGKPVSLEGACYSISDTFDGSFYTFSDLSTNEMVDVIQGVRNPQKNSKFSNIYRSVSNGAVTVLNTIGDKNGELELTISADSENSASWIPVISAE